MFLCYLLKYHPCLKSTKRVETSTEIKSSHPSGVGSRLAGGWLTLDLLTMTLLKKNTELSRE